MTDSPDAAAAGGSGATSMGIDPKLAGLLAYLLGVISGLVIFLVEKQHQEVRYHAAQSIIVSVALIAANIVVGILSVVPVLGLIISILGYLVLGLGGLALWIYLMIQGYQLNHVRLPVAGDLAEQWVRSGNPSA